MSYVEHTLPGMPAARRTDPDTSHAAAASITPGRTERMILSLLYPALILTDDEICELLGSLHPPTVKSARSRLTKAGLLVDTGERRPSNRGRDQIVWRLA